MSPLFGPAIAIHATAGTLALLAGVVLLVRPGWMRHPWVRRTWFALMVMLAVFLTAAVVVGWPDMDLIRRLADIGLVGLAGYTLFRSAQAVRVSSVAAQGWALRMTDHLGFAVISLFDGFVIVAAIRGGLPGWAVGAIAVSGVATGIVVLNALKRRPAVAAA